jgi:hypothetical protein
MYPVDERDRVIELKTVPQPSVGAPMPTILSDEQTTMVAYLNEEGDEEPDYRQSSKTLITFRQPIAHMFGPPNDEAFSGHPLASRGLVPHSFFVIEHSSWVRGLERMNRVHPYHDSKRFDAYQHFVLSFHDSTFECISKDYEFEVFREAPQDVLDKMKQRLDLFQTSF